MPRRNYKNYTINKTVLENGIEVEPVPLTAGETVRIGYGGFLAQSGANQIFLHAGYGSADDYWRDVRDIPMQRADGGWEASFPVHDASRLHFCFRDQSGRWDNNNGQNWHLEIHNGTIA